MLLALEGDDSMHSCSKLRNKAEKSGVKKSRRFVKELEVRPFFIHPQGRLHELDH